MSTINSSTYKKQIITTKRGSSSYPNLPPLGYIPSFGGAWGGFN
ncbi:hypothetical protein HMPREF0973_02544 [Prevotella veroralis F0319]|uniref:Uncharacterized protein n=1 Tax=Prevotella veroralis F0319 TaxID=649761 RepID=C9MSC5_9BACT|nr:hypothetical protein HMPREF0973_02544 [Prevotella veroralis F0319]